MKKSDTVVVDDPAGRRRFIRTGAAFVLAGTAAASSTANAQEEPQRVDCDRQGLGEEKAQDVAGSDSDSGAQADRPGCGRKKPVMTHYKKNQDGSGKMRVKKIVV